MNRRWSGFMWLFVCFFVFTGLPAHSQDSSARVQEYVQRAFEHNARLSRLHETAESAREEIRPAGALEDPRLQAGTMNLPADNYSFDDHPMTSKDLALMQKVPYPGKLDRRQKQTMAKFRATRAEMFVYRAELAHQVRSTIFDWWVLRQTQQIVHQEQDQLDRLLPIARRQYETGDGIQADLERVSSRGSRLENRLLKLNQREQRLRERLRRLLGYVGELPQEPPTVSPDTGADPRSAVEEIDKTSPVLRRDTELVRAARHGVRLAELDYYPNVDLGLRFRQREDRDDFVSFSVTIPLPIWSNQKQTPWFRSKQHQLNALRSRYRDDRDELQYSFTEANDRLRRLRRQLELYDDQLLPEAERTFDSTLSAYRVGRVEFNTVLEAEQNLFRVREERIEIRADHQKTLSELARIAGYEQMEDL